MKTKFTTIAMMILSLAGFAAQKEQSKLKIARLSLPKTETASLPLLKIPDGLKNFSVAGNPKSIPQYSENYLWESNSWQHVSNSSYTYDGIGRLTEETARDPETDDYLSYKFLTYDPYGNVREESEHIWGSGRWIPVSGKRLVYYQNPGGYSDGIIEQTMDNGTWLNQYKIEFIPHDYQMDFPAGMQIYQWDGTGWSLYSRYVSVSWTNWRKREMKSYVLQYWQNNQWINAERFSAQYNGSNYTAVTEIQENAKWVNSKRETYFISETNEEFILETWDAGEWAKTEKYETTFDYKGNPTGIKYNLWSENHWAVDMAFMFDLTYNESDDVTQMIVRYWDPTLVEAKNVSKNVFSDFLRLTTDVPQIGNLQNVNVFPNPVSSNFTIQIDDNQITNYQVNILNIAGHTILSNYYSDSSITVNAEGLTPGMYLLNIKSDEGKIYTGKIIKK